MGTESDAGCLRLPTGSAGGDDSRGTEHHWRTGLYRRRLYDHRALFRTKCGLKNEEAKVMPKASPDDDVIEWVREVVTRSVYVMHTLKSPHCNATTISALKIPVNDKDGEGWIGKDNDIVPPKGDL